ncbi:hypothetical protein BU15DRAFT_75615 [Melanogaster broomeanus]|nr:hypothetical protein BU15DRAFT_75615 [Melanogaster broomeanus]
MATDPQSILATLRLSDYLSLVIVTAIAYDYVLTLPREVKHVWVSIFEYLLRYQYITSDDPKEQALDLDVYRIPPCVSVIWALFLLCVRISSDALEVPNSWIHNLKGTILFQVYLGTNIVFFAAVDLIMVLRVYAMYGRSRTILAILLATYIPSVVVSCVTTIYKPQIDVSVLFDATICTASYNVPTSIGVYFLIPKVVLSVVLCGFAVIRLVRESLQMHRAIKKWQSNQYLELLVRESVFYFVAYVVFVRFFVPNELTSELFALLNLATSNLFAHVVPMVIGAGVMQELSSLLLYTLGVIAPVVLPPRLIINLREHHTHVVGDHIDTGFGVISRHPISTNENIVFANADVPTETIGDYRKAEETSEIV